MCAQFGECPKSGLKRPRSLNPKPPRYVPVVGKTTSCAASPTRSPKGFTADSEQFSPLLLCPTRPNHTDRFNGPQPSGMLCVDEFPQMQKLPLHHPPPRQEGGSSLQPLFRQTHTEDQRLTPPSHPKTTETPERIGKLGLASSFRRCGPGFEIILIVVLRSTPRPTLAREPCPDCSIRVFLDPAVGM